MGIPEIFRRMGRKVEGKSKTSTGGITVVGEKTGVPFTAGPQINHEASIFLHGKHAKQVVDAYVKQAKHGGPMIGVWNDKTQSMDMTPVMIDKKQ